ncbi:hypothetical protein [Paenibacillus kribbensis]|uniref:hypothetical protein n=1 Tax=Paenibacillus kribbensis TaxID=172713 RepID=UPI0015C06A25|nr:hypothetical protein [Paenibacillus kribbensis]
MQKIDPVTQRPQLDAQGKEVTEKVEMLTGFKPVNVFDVSQTKGKELANLRAIIRDDIKDNHRAAELYSSLSNHIGKKMDIRESADDFKDQPKIRGYYDRVNNAIRFNPDVENTTMKLKTLIHEYAHAQLHRMTVL